MRKIKDFLSETIGKKEKKAKDVGEAKERKWIKKERKRNDSLKVTNQNWLGVGGGGERIATCVG